MRYCLAAAIFIVLVGFASPAAAQTYLVGKMDQALRDLRVIEAGSLTGEDRKEYDAALAMVRAARRAAEAFGAGAADLAEQAAGRVAQVLRRVLKIDVEARLAGQYLTGGAVDALLDAAALLTTRELERLADLMAANQGRLGWGTSASRTSLPGWSPPTCCCTRA